MPPVPDGKSEKLAAIRSSRFAKMPCLLAPSVAIDRRLDDPILTGINNEKFRVH